MQDKKQQVNEPLLANSFGGDEIPPAANETSSSNEKTEKKADPEKGKTSALRPEHKMTAFNIFMTLHEDNEIDYLLEMKHVLKLKGYVQKEQGLAEETAGALLEDCFRQTQSSGFLNLDQFYQFIEKCQLKKCLNDIDDQLYGERYKRFWCKCFLNACCKADYAKQRKRNLQKAMQDYNSMKRNKEDQEGIVKVTMVAFASCIFGYLNISDFLTDIYLTYQVYNFNMMLKNDEVKRFSYLIAMMVCLNSLIGPYFLTQGSIINMKYSQRHYESSVLKSRNCVRKTLDTILLACYGTSIVILLDLIESAKKLFSIFGLLCKGQRGYNALINFFDNLSCKLTNLSQQQLRDLDEQRKISRLFFENLPQCLLILCINTNLLDCEDLRSKQQFWIQLSLAFTIWQIIENICKVKLYASALQESTLVYLITKMTANNQWIPYIHLISNRQRKDININYGHILIRIPFYSNATGSYLRLTYDFSDETLNYLLKELSMWSTELTQEEKEGIKQKYQLRFTNSCLKMVSKNMLIHFIQNCPRDIFELQFTVNWEDYYDKQKEKEQFIYTGKKANLSPLGESLQELCIKNEVTDKNWTLKQLFIQMINDKEYQANEKGYGSLLNFAILNQCFQSVQNILDNIGDKFDFQEPESNGLSILGNLCLTLKQQNENQPEFLKSMLKSFITKGIDLHRPQFSNLHYDQGACTAIQFVYKNLRRDKEIKYPIDVLLDEIQNQDAKASSEQEKNTLYKNSCKLLLNQYDDNNVKLQECVEILGYATQMCEFDILLHQEKNNKNIAHRVFQLGYYWQESSRKDTDPAKNSISYLKQNLEMFYKTNPEESSLKKIFEQGSKPEVLNILLTRDNHFMRGIIDLDKEYDLNINQEAFIDPLLKFIVNSHDSWDDAYFHNFETVIKHAKERITGIDVEAKIYQLGKERNKSNALQKLKEISGRTFSEFEQVVDQNDQDQEANKNSQDQDNKIIKENKLVIKETREGNLKRNVQNGKVQGDVVVEKLTGQQVKLMKINNVISNQSGANKTNWGNVLRLVLELILEWIALCDFVSDFVVLRELSKTEHIFWTSLALLSMLAPYYVSQVPLLVFLKERIIRLGANQKIISNSYLKIIGAIMVNPLMLIFLQFMDCVYLINSAILVPIVYVLIILTCTKIDLTCLIATIERSYEVLFDMKKLDVAGFRRMRTISQMTFETFIQFFLQVRMLIYFRHQDKKSMQVSYWTIIVSALLSVLHTLLEGLFLWMEAQVTKTSFVNYSIICFNGRFGWLPYQDFLTHAIQNEQDDEDSQNETDSKKQVKLNFGDITSKVFGFNLTVDFEFSNDTFQTLIKLLSTFPKNSNQRMRPDIRFGDSVKNIDIEKIRTLLKVCQNRITINLEGIDLEEKIRRSQYDRLLNIDANGISDKEKSYLFNLLEDDLYQLFEVYLQQNAKLVDVKKTMDDKQLNFAQLIIKYFDHRLLEVMLKLNNKQFLRQLGEVINRESIFMKLIQSNNFKILKVLSTHSALINNQLVQVYADRANDWVANDQSQWEKSKEFWHARCGPGIPEIIPKHLSKKHIFNEFKGMYPKSVFLSIGNEFAEFETVPLYYFAVLRKILAQAWHVDGKGPQNDLLQKVGRQKCPLDVSSLQIPLRDLKLLNMLLSKSEHEKVLSLTEERIDDLDKYVRQLQLDTDRYVYIGQTRLNDQTGNALSCTYYGQDIWLIGNKQTKTYYEIYTDDGEDKQNIEDSLRIDLPKEMNCVSEFQYEYDSSTSCQDIHVHTRQLAKVQHAYLAEMWRYKDYNKMTIDTTKLCFDQEMNGPWFKYCLTLDSFFDPDSNVSFQAGEHKINISQQMIDYKVILKMDFPSNTDFQSMQQHLEQKCQESYQQYLDSKEVFEKKKQSDPYIRYYKWDSSKNQFGVGR